MHTATGYDRTGLCLLHALDLWKANISGDPFHADDYEVCVTRNASNAVQCNAAEANQRKGTDSPHDAHELSLHEPHGSPSFDSKLESAAQTPFSAEP